ncbi:hypothetical protein ACU635_59410 [[Actinomadura] parvosata]|uniref:hypothetical protein n=1 Tax=[Actinomadura] parvosata TaxID=1955412 RepID=UPI00406C2AB0
MIPSLRRLILTLTTAATSIAGAALLTAAPAHADAWGDCRPTDAGYTCHKLLEASVLTCLDGGGDVPDDLLTNPTQIAHCAGGRWDGVKLDQNEARRYAENARAIRNLLGNLDDVV